jgi:hypothetical protein
MPAIPIIGAVAGAAGTAGVISAGVATGIGAAATIGGAVYNASQAKKANNAAQTASDNFVAQPAPTMDINALDAQAREFSAKNAAESAAMREKYNPGVTQLQNDSLAQIMAKINQNGGGVPLGDRNTQWDQGYTLPGRDGTYNGAAPGPSATPARSTQYDAGPVIDPNTGQLMQKVVDQAGR